MAEIVVGLRDLARLGAHLVDHWAEGGGDIDGGDVWDWLKSTGVVEAVPGGFDSDKHEAGPHDVMDGDPWFETTKAVKVARRWLELKAQRALDAQTKAPATEDQERPTDS